MKSLKYPFFRRTNKDTRWENITNFICKLKANKEMEKPKLEKYTKSVIEGKYSDVIVKDEEIVNLISDWTKNGEPINAFRKILKQIGVQFPITLRKKGYVLKNEFFCETADKRPLVISLYFCRLSIDITEYTKTSCYSYSAQEVSVQLKSTTFSHRGIKVYSYYDGNTCYRNMVLRSGDKLEIEVFKDCPKGQNNIVLSQKVNDKVDLYLLSIAELPISSFNTWSKRIKEIYEFTNIAPYFICMSLLVNIGGKRVQLITNYTCNDYIKTLD